jgi:hypothetical protein
MAEYKSPSIVIEVNITSRAIDLVARSRYTGRSRPIYNYSNTHYSSLESKEALTQYLSKHANLLDIIDFSKTHLKTEEVKKRLFQMRTLANSETMKATLTLNVTTFRAYNGLYLSLEINPKALCKKIPKMILLNEHLLGETGWQSTPDSSPNEINGNIDSKLSAAEEVIKQALNSCKTENDIQRKKEEEQARAREVISD